MFWKTDTLPCPGNTCNCTDNRLVNRELNLNKLFGQVAKSPYYKNNHNLRGSDVLFEFTDEEIIEYNIAKDDILYFYYLSQKSKRNKLELYKFQEDLLKSTKQKRYNLVVNSRQSGMSYILAIKALHSVFSSYDKTTLIVSNIGEDGSRILGLVKDIYQTLPFYLKPGIKVWNTKSITFDNGSKILSTTSNKISYGIDYDNVIIQDYTSMSYEDKMSICRNLIPTLISKSDSGLLLTSIPNGEEHFKDLVDDVNSFFTKHKIHWSDIPSRDDVWKRNMIKRSGIEMFAQDYENLFTGTKEWNRFINLNKLLD
jgi:hypothetical protein